jgi:4-hydroxybenzoate polyprenyltransferase
VAKLLAPALLAAGGAVAAVLPPAFALLLGAYFVATLAYSLALKRKVVADVIALAGLYTSRLFAGALATGVPVSEWLATFAMFLFLSLALVKRASELLRAESETPGRGYQAVDLHVVLAMGTSSAFLAVLVLALYVSSDHVRLLYARPIWLWGLCPTVLYWTGRIWIDARRGKIEGDPLYHALTHRVTWASAAAGAVFLLLGA